MVPMTTASKTVPNEPDETWPCGWAYQAFFEGEAYTAFCGAPAHPWKAGWACEAGHFHRGIEIEWAEDAARESLVRAGLLPEEASL